MEKKNSVRFREGEDLTEFEGSPKKSITPKEISPKRQVSDITEPKPNDTPVHHEKNKNKTMDNESTEADDVEERKDSLDDSRDSEQDDLQLKFFSMFQTINRIHGGAIMKIKSGVTGYAPEKDSFPLFGAVRKWCCIHWEEDASPASWCLAYYNDPPVWFEEALTSVAKAKSSSSSGAGGSSPAGGPSLLQSSLFPLPPLAQSVRRIVSKEITGVFCEKNSNAFRMYCGREVLQFTPITSYNPLSKRGTCWADSVYCIMELQNETDGEMVQLYKAQFRQLLVEHRRKEMGGEGENEEGEQEEREGEGDGNGEESGHINEETNETQTRSRQRPRLQRRTTLSNIFGISASFPQFTSAGVTSSGKSYEEEEGYGDGSNKNSNNDGGGGEKSGDERDGSSPVKRSSSGKLSFFGAVSMVMSGGARRQSGGGEDNREGDEGGEGESGRESLSNSPLRRQWLVDKSSVIKRANSGSSVGMQGGAVAAGSKKKSSMWSTIAKSVKGAGSTKSGRSKNHSGGRFIDPSELQDEDEGEKGESTGQEKGNNDGEQSKMEGEEGDNDHQKEKEVSEEHKEGTNQEGWMMRDRGNSHESGYTSDSTGSQGSKKTPPPAPLVAQSSSSFSSGLGFLTQSLMSSHKGATVNSQPPPHISSTSPGGSASLALRTFMANSRYPQTREVAQERSAMGGAASRAFTAAPVIGTEDGHGTTATANPAFNPSAARERKVMQRRYSQFHVPSPTSSATKATATNSTSKSRNPLARAKSPVMGTRPTVLDVMIIQASADPYRLASRSNDGDDPAQATTVSSAVIRALSPPRNSGSNYASAASRTTHSPSPPPPLVYPLSGSASGGRLGDDYYNNTVELEPAQMRQLLLINQLQEMSLRREREEALVVEREQRSLWIQQEQAEKAAEREATEVKRQKDNEEFTALLVAQSQANSSAIHHYHQHQTTRPAASLPAIPVGPPVPPSHAPRRPLLGAGLIQQQQLQTQTQQTHATAAASGTSHLNNPKQVAAQQKLSTQTREKKIQKLLQPVEGNGEEGKHSKEKNGVREKKEGESGGVTTGESDSLPTPAVTAPTDKDKGGASAAPLSPQKRTPQDATRVRAHAPLTPPNQAPLQYTLGSGLLSPKKVNSATAGGRVSAAGQKGDVRTARSSSSEAVGLAVGAGRKDEDTHPTPASTQPPPRTLLDQWRSPPKWSNDFQFHSDTITPSSSKNASNIKRHTVGGGGGRTSSSSPKSSFRLDHNNSGSGDATTMSKSAHKHGSRPLPSQPVAATVPGGGTNNVTIATLTALWFDRLVVCRILSGQEVLQCIQSHPPTSSLPHHHTTTSSLQPSSPSNSFRVDSVNELGAALLRSSAVYQSNHNKGHASSPTSSSLTVVERKKRLTSPASTSSPNGGSGAGNKNVASIPSTGWRVFAQRTGAALQAVEVDGKYLVLEEPEQRVLFVITRADILSAEWDMNGTGLFRLFLSLPQQVVNHHSAGSSSSNGTVKDGNTQRNSTIVGKEKEMARKPTNNAPHTTSQPHLEAPFYGTVVELYHQHVKSSSLLPPLPADSSGAGSTTAVGTTHRPEVALVFRGFPPSSPHSSSPSPSDTLQQWLSTLML